MMAYYEDQKKEAKRRAKDFRDNRIPKYLGWFERALHRAPDGWLTGDRWCYADLSLFQLIDGLRHAFPERMAAVTRDCPKLLDLHERVSDLPELQAYFASDRRQRYGDGIFRHYPELDSA
jgi:glutathione S-transferase